MSILKEYSRLFIVLFITSMFISLTFITARADSTKSTTIIYNAPSASEANHYTINIPSTIEVDSNGGEMQITLDDGYEIDSDYRVIVRIAPECFIEGTLESTNARKTSKSNDYILIRLYQAGSTDSYYSLEALNSTNHIMSAGDSPVACITSNGMTTPNGKITFVRNKNGSNDKQNTNGGRYTGTITFNITGESI